MSIIAAPHAVPDLVVVCPRCETVHLAPQPQLCDQCGECIEDERPAPMYDGEPQFGDYESRR